SAALAALASREADERRTGAATLGRLGLAAGAESVPALAALLDADPVRAVRLGAAAALLAIAGVAAAETAESAPAPAAGARDEGREP
ncbi:MAG TPA: HEAT repeat domain-containing protein, partial [Myxococcota bacterium]|nr:HEAT repeat domain-containing protein [Myxococcota bacterium]